MQIKCNGQGFGCGFSLAQGTSFGQGQAEAFARSVTAAFVGPNSGICLADIRALATAIAEATASSQSKYASMCWLSSSAALGLATSGVCCHAQPSADLFCANRSCVNGRGSASQFSSAFVQSVTVAVARAFAVASAEVCGSEAPGSFECHLLILALCMICAHAHNSLCHHSTALSVCNSCKPDNWMIAVAVLLINRE